jgi:hypothetical protein
MADVMRAGTKSKTGDQIDEGAGEHRGGSVEGGMDETSASVSFSGLKGNCGSGAGCLQRCAHQSGVPQDKLDLT